MKHKIKRRIKRRYVAHKSDVHHFKLVQSVDDITVCHCVFERHPHVVVTSCGIQLDSHTISTLHVDQDVDDFETEPRTVFDTTTPLVGSGVGRNVQKLPYQILIRSVYWMRCGEESSAI